MKVLLLDADGVVLKKGEYFSERFAREHNVSVEGVVEFFKGPFVACQKGDADLKEEIKPYLEKWGWQGTVEEFLDYWFKSDVVLNPEIDEAISGFKQKGVKVYLASNNEKYRAAAIETVLSERGLLDGSYFSSYLNVRKENPQFFQKVIDDLGVEPQEVAFVDNDKKNVDSALSLGIDARLYEPDILSKFI